VHQTVLRKWVGGIVSDPAQTLPGNGRQGPEQAEIARLKRQVIRLKAARDIFKKTAAYFARENT
jgi:transposase